MGKKKSFPEGPKAFGLLVMRYGGKHYRNAVLELLFVGGQLVLLTWTSPQTTKRVTGNCSYRSLEKWTGDVNQSHWKLQASLGNAVGKFSPQYMAFFSSYQTKLPKFRRFPCKSLHSEEDSEANEPGKGKLLVSNTESLSYSWGTLRFSLTDWRVIINPISQHWLH